MPTTPRLFVSADLSAGHAVALDEEQSNYLLRVLRLGAGGEVRLFNGRHGEWDAAISAAGKKAEVSPTVQRRPQPPPARPALTLLFAPVKKDETDLIVEKATELGVATVQPLMTDRSVLRLDGERAQRKRDHWQGIAVAASEQSGRTRVPAVAPVLALGPWLADRSGDRPG